jgi:ATP-dependent helicase HrpA
VKPISQSSAEQRKGRAGRTASGLCIRLYSLEDFLARSLYTKPEILRANLAEVILRMLSLRLGDIFDFPFIDRPDTKSIADGYQLLLELGAVRKDRQQGYRLTESGRIMARIPVDPRISRMLLQAQQEGCTEDILVLAAALSISDPKERPADKAGEADASHRKFFDPWSDFTTFLNIWNRYRSERAGGGTTSQNERRRFCKQHFLSYRRMREWQDIHGQLVEILEECGLKTQNAPLPPEPDPADAFGPRYAAIHRSILAGFLSNIALRKEKNFYRAARDRDVMLFPGSCLFNRNAMWIVAAEMVETSRVFARIAGRIDNKWIEPIGRHLCRYAYLHPHWEKNRGAVVATEQVSLFGLIVETGKTVSYGRIDPEEAARIFVRSALMEGDIKQRFAFLEHNRAVIERIRDTENRLRRRDLLVSDAEIEAFYLERIGRISDVRSLQHLIRQNGGDDALRMQETEMMNYEPDMDVERLFPDAIQIGESTLTCRYRFDPGKPEDGLTVPVSISQVERLPHASLGWMVPGFFKAKVEALIKGLPKTYRKQLVPVNKTVEIITAQMPREDGDLFASLSRFIESRFNVSIPTAEWSESGLPDYLKTRIEVIGTDGKVISSGRSARDIRPPKPGDMDIHCLQRIRAQIEKEDVGDWDFDDLPETTPVTGPSGETWLLYPGLQARRNLGERQEPVVDLKLFLDRKEASVSHLRGVAALYVKRFPQEFSFLRKAVQMPSPARGKKSQEAMHVETALFEGILIHLFAKPIRSRQAFLQHAQDTFPDMLRFASELKGLASGIEQARRETLETIGRIRSQMTINPLTKDFFQELDDRLHTLLPADYLARYDLDRLKELPRYLRAIAIRAQRASLAFEKDRTKARQVRTLEERYRACSKRLDNHASEDVLRSLETLFWWIEEYRVSLFAQELGTAIPISAKRIEKALDSLDRTPMQ